MKTITTLLLALLLATSASAIIDPDPDHIGLYFDLEADMFCIDGVYPLEMKDLYLILTNPSFEYVYGFEAGLSWEGLVDVLSVEINNPQALNVGTTTNLIVGFGTPLPTEPATLLATWQVLYLEMEGDVVFFDLHGSEPSSIDPLYPAVVIGDGEVMALGTSGGTSPEAQINWCGSPVDRVSFDRSKSLYR